MLVQSITIQYSQPTVFIHLPRTGGTTFHNLAQSQFEAGQVLHIKNWADVARLERMSLAKRSELRFVHGHVGFALDGALALPHYNVTILRDPVQRVASAYRYIRSNPDHTHHDRVAGRGMSFTDFIRGRVSPINIDNGMTRILCGMGDNAEQVEFGGCTRAMLEAAKKNLSERVTVIGLTEQFDASIVLMRQRFGWKSPLYSSKNSTRKGTVEQTLTRDEIALVQKHNELDQALYRHARMLFARQYLFSLPLIPVQVRYFQYKNRVHKQDQEAFKRLRQFESKRIARWLHLK